MSAPSSRAALIAVYQSLPFSGLQRSMVMFSSAAKEAEDAGAVDERIWVILMLDEGAAV